MNITRPKVCSIVTVHILAVSMGVAAAAVPDQLVHINYDIVLTVNGETGHVSQRGQSRLGKVILVDMGKHQIRLLLSHVSKDKYGIAVNVYELTGNDPLKLNDTVPVQESLFGVPAQMLLENDLLSLDASLIVSPFSNRETPDTGALIRDASTLLTDIPALEVIEQ